ncbi:MAG: hypothetical protein KAT43_06735 [Nanoarchaeota archaeon]|nr:hypothetical protein [Nanoarchaeota archaeon]
MMHNIKFPREVANPKRYVIANKEEFFKFINANNGSSNLYTNVYNYSEFKPPFMYPNYDSAIIDRIYFDLDQRVKEEGYWVNVPAYEYMMRIHEWCLENDIKHLVRCTGTGYDAIIITDPKSVIKNKKNAVGNAQAWLCKKLDIKMDKQVMSDTARIHRVDNTFNIKDTTRRYCIPLDKEIINLGEKKIFEIAKEQRFSSNTYGTKCWDISRFDTPEALYKDFLPLENIEINEEDFADLSEKIPICIKNFLAQEDLGWKERRCVILALRDNCYLQDEALAILKRHLSVKKFTHCIRDEKQLQYLYRNDKYMFPWQDGIIELNACPFAKGKFCELAKNGCLLYGRKRQ